MTPNFPRLILDTSLLGGEECLAARYTASDMPQLTAVLLGLALLLPQQPSPPIEAPQPFTEWLDGVVAEAQTRGYSAAVIEQTLAGLEPLPRVVENDRTQAEVTLTFERYYAARVTPQVVRRGRELAQANQSLLTRLERTYGVPRSVVLAIWGMESRYGRNAGRIPVFQALATLAWEPRRADFFRGQLFNAMTMVERGYIGAAAMTGSWAGAMGQPQFMPSRYLDYAVDFDNDGDRDIWSSTGDTLASIANYLRGYGWETGLTWGREVRVSAEAREALEAKVPKRTEGCSSRRTMSEYRPLGEWRDLGVRSATGGPLPAADVYAAYAELAGKSYLLYPNYDALLGYNCAHLYALSVAMLSDRLR